MFFRRSMGANKVTEGITPRQFHATEGVEDWRAVGEGVSAYFRTGSLATGARFVEAISQLPGIDEDHHPDVDLRYEGVTVRLSTITVTHYYDGHSSRDVDLARRISAVARDLGIPAAAEDLIDPHGRWPSFWFQHMDTPRPQRSRVHIDISVPHDHADARVAAALAAGGRRVDEQRPWVLADPEGNEACLGATNW